MAQLLEIKSVRTVIDYCDYIEESYLFDLIPMYSTSIRKQLANPKKAYCIDPAFSAANSISFSKDLGKRLENFVYLHLWRSFKTRYYYRSKNSECDFLVRWNEEIVGAIQVCRELNTDNIERETKGIRDAMKETGLPTGSIITYNQEDSFEGITVIPVWKWFLQSASAYFQRK